MTRISEAPIRFETQFKEKIWGGSKIRDVLSKDFSPLPNCGETWELSGVAHNVSIVKNGLYKGRSLNDLINEFGGDLLGKDIYEKYGNSFPLLIKFIDAQDDLSIQVHPNDEAAAKFNSFGKTEMWYVIDAEPNARLVSGLKENVTLESYNTAVRNNDLGDILNWVSVYEGDVFFIPAGKVHSIGKGILLAEIQQSSDLTFRIFDFDRVESDGSKRELHNDQAIQVINFTSPEDPKTSYIDRLNDPVKLVSCDFFTTSKLVLDEEVHYNLDHESFTILICLDGDLLLNGERFLKGEVVLIPAVNNQIQLTPKSKTTILEVHID